MCQRFGSRRCLRGSVGLAAPCDQLDAMAWAFAAWPLLILGVLGVDKPDGALLQIRRALLVLGREKRNLTST